MCYNCDQDAESGTLVCAVIYCPVIRRRVKWRQPRDGLEHNNRSHMNLHVLAGGCVLLWGTYRHFLASDRRPWANHDDPTSELHLFSNNG